LFLLLWTSAWTCSYIRNTNL